MANVYRTEYEVKGTAQEIKKFIVEVIGDGATERQYFDLEKIIPLDGQEMDTAWGSESEAFNFQLCHVSSTKIVFRFDTNNCTPLHVCFALMNKYTLLTFNVRSCCELLIEAVRFVKDPRIQGIGCECHEWNDDGGVWRKYIKNEAKYLWGYSNKPNLEKRGFVKIGNTYVKVHFGISLEELRPRFKVS
ncbi:MULTISPECIES: hypothetical protein [Pseudomonas]|uniref:Uncharacterized protein n=2 Tax=Pseudomonas simiae TaxID=321846 RepID=A0ABS9G9V1_9PSED|nr:MULTISPECIES: hypothetical protein [Pseudomonas]MCF5188631.1 hypothetical protein [Pseudomonas simiae]MCF5289471.1 hypothetical protein [Pseudomonas simiae]MCF5321789.1 hypothetical protein [Pseudomonas simiae]MCF5338361.1 hypothetical protein [Pseudomonas simiae]MCF5344103.1 hypothetical protein [Pseudomonas simiae]